ncbi:MAG: c-type cytochrome [Nitrospira sp.]
MVLAAFLLAASNGNCTEPAAKTPPRKGDAREGKAVFNGKGICHYCHGLDGVIDRKPSLTPDTEAVIARLAAASPDLRNRATLKLKDNKARFRVIREGHPGSGMLPDTTLSDQDITDVLAYLATLRQSATPSKKKAY